MSKQRMKGLSTLGLIKLTAVVSAVALGAEYTMDHHLIQIYQNHDEALDNLHQLEEAERMYVKAHSQFSGDFTHLLMPEAGGANLVQVFNIFPNSKPERTFFMNGPEFMDVHPRPDYVYQFDVKLPLPRRLELELVAAHLQATDYRCRHYHVVMSFEQGVQNPSENIQTDEACIQDDPT